MTLRAAIVIAIELLREQGDRDPQHVKAERVLQKKADRLGQQNVARANRRPCPRCGRNTGNVVCLSCWPMVPYELRIGLTNARTEELKRQYLREILTWAKANPARREAA